MATKNTTGALREAHKILFDNSVSQLTSDNVGDAIDEVNGKTDELKENLDELITSDVQSVTFSNGNGNITPKSGYIPFQAIILGQWYTSKIHIDNSGICSIGGRNFNETIAISDGVYSVRVFFLKV